MDSDDVDPLLVASFNTGQELYDWAVENDILDNYFVQERLCHLSFRIPDQHTTLPPSSDPSPPSPDSVHSGPSGYRPNVAAADLDSDAEKSPDSPVSVHSSSSEGNDEFDIARVRQEVKRGKNHQCPKRCGASFKTFTELVNHKKVCKGRDTEQHEQESAVYTCKVNQNFMHY